MNTLIDHNSEISKLKFIGGKAYHLFLLGREGVRVPSWFCVSSEVFRQQYQIYRKNILKEIQNIELKNLESIKSAATKIEGIFLEDEISPTLKKELDARLDRDKIYVVRSSGLDEDSHENSFAGQLSTFLNVKAEGVEEAIKKCWASLFSERNIQYRIVNGIHSEPEMGVIVQEMITAQASGVMFTAHPLMGKHFLDEIVINAGYGMGEGVVSDRVEVDTYIFNKSEKRIVDSKYSVKTQMMVPNKKEGLNLVDVEESKQKASVLTHEQIKKLASLGLQIKGFFEAHQDIEWCIDASDKIFITQARPITTIKQGINKLDFLFDNSNIVESFPGVNTPWTLGQIRDIYRIVFKRACLRLGFSRSQVNENNYLFTSLLGMYRGRLFLNLTHWYSMMRFIPFTEKYIETWEEMLGVRRQVENKSSWDIQQMGRVGIVCSRLFFYLLSLDFYLKKLDRKMKKEFDQFWKLEQQQEFLRYTPAESIDRIESFKAKLFEDSELTLINDIYAFIFTAMTKKVIKIYTKKEPDQAFNQIMYGISGMDSIKPLNSLRGIANFVQQNESLRQELNILFQYPHLNLNLLSPNVESKKFIEMFHEHIANYGDRGANELKLETITFREGPRNLLRLILDYAEKPIHQSDQKNMSIKEFARSEFRNFLTRSLFTLTAKMAIRSITYRENFRLHRSRAYGVLRRMTNNLGEKIAALGDISSARDIYFLEKSDLYNYYSGLTFEYDLKKRIQHNKKLFHQYLKEDVSYRYQIKQGKFSEVRTQEEKFDSSLKGIGCSSGLIRGEVVVIKDPAAISQDADLVKDKILVSKMTDPGWVFLMAVAKGLLVEKGSLLSHTAIIGRELGIPTIVGAEGATERLKTGDTVEMNAETGEIKVIKC